VWSCCPAAAERQTCWLARSHAPGLLLQRGPGSCKEPAGTVRPCPVPSRTRSVAVLGGVLSRIPLLGIIWEVTPALSTGLTKPAVLLRRQVLATRRPALPPCPQRLCLCSCSVSCTDRTCTQQCHDGASKAPYEDIQLSGKKESKTGRRHEGTTQANMFAA
jgi:hypothetical protein